MKTIEARSDPQTVTLLNGMNRKMIATITPLLAILGSITPFSAEKPEPLLMRVERVCRIHSSLYMTN
jgi:hypothetical protein